MSANKIKSLRLQKSQRCESQNKVEDTSMMLAEETKTHMERIDLSSKNRDSSTPLHSTPKRSTGKSSSTQEQSGIDYRVSPILLPCTQDGGNEVAWDWQSPLTKTNVKCNKNSLETIGTPKRTTVLQKKRNSNSPLLYKPIKRKLMRSDYQQESIDKFTAEMKALSEQIKPTTRDEISNEEINPDEGDLMIEIDIADFVESENKLELTASDGNASRKNVETVKTSMKDLFDDSIEDSSMVRCSQEIEEKLRLECSREKSLNRNSANSTETKESSFSWHQQSRLLNAKEKSSNETRNSSKSVCLENSKKSVKEIPPVISDVTKSCINNNVTKIEKPTETPAQTDLFDIPDDSFDDFIAICDEVENPKVEQETNQSTNRYGKVYVSPHSSCSSENPRKYENMSARKILLPPPSQSSSSVVKALSNVGKSGCKNFSRSVSNDNLKPNSITVAEKTMTTATTTTTTNEGRKFFKTKSLSTSSFDEKGAISKNVNTTNSSLTTRGWKSNMFTNGSTSVSNCQRLQPNNTDFKENSNAWQYKTNGNDGNRGICNFNRNAPREDDSFKFKGSNGFVAEIASGLQSTQICTKEEIERKRLEAKMKLEAKRKLLGRSSSTSALPGEKSSKPVKR